ncbi:MAG: phosphoglucomutase/phosphomannomutase family protein [Anaerolineae bacterium]|nr:phosphoglucomutase/phosphomannomutase family protein [Anaerolineae bacterium]
MGAARFVRPVGADDGRARHEAAQTGTQPVTNRRTALETIIRFGTDGWRGRIADDYTFDNVRRCAQGFAHYLAAQGQGGSDIVIGHDRRFLARQFAIAAAEVMAAHGFHVWLTEGPTPTPVISYAAVERGAAGAINITASHNPPWDGGFKVRDARGAAVDPDGLHEIEAAIPSIDQVQRVDFDIAQADGRITVWNPDPAYIDHIGQLVDVERIKAAGLDVLVEPMWGNGIGWFQRLLEGGRTRVTEIHNVPNPLFPEMSRPEPIPPNVDVALRKTVELSADVCLILDGDADRMGIGDENGTFVNQLQVYALMAYYLLEIRGQRGAIVKTLSTTSMLEKLGQLYDVPVYQTGVGFKYVGPKMLETDALIGGEESGGYAFRGSVPERDGILGNLYFLDLMVQTGKSPAQLLNHLYDTLGATYYYDRVDTRFPSEKRPEAKARIDAARPEQLAGMKVTDIVTLDGYKFVLEDGGWLLIRFSGTEPIIRVYCETTDESKVQPLLRAGLEIAGLA